MKTENQIRKACRIWNDATNPSVPRSQFGHQIRRKLAGKVIAWIREHGRGIVAERQNDSTLYVTSIRERIDRMQEQILPGGRRDRYSCAHAENDAFQFSKDWKQIRCGDREASLFLAVEILKENGLEYSAKMILENWFQE